MVVVIGGFIVVAVVDDGLGLEAVGFELLTVLVVTTGALVTTEFRRIVDDGGSAGRRRGTDATDFDLE